MSVAESENMHCLLIFNSQNEPLLSIFDEYIESLVILPHRSGYNDAADNISVENIIMQIFTPLLASQSAMMDMLNTRFRIVELYNGKTLVMTKIHNCYVVILLSEQCLYRKHDSMISKKLELIEWLICSFYGICWHRMMPYNNNWLKTILKEMWLMDETEFNLNFWCNERIDLSPHLKLTEKVLEVLVSNSKYLRQINERKIKHQLVLVGSKLFCLYTSDIVTDLKPRHTLLFVLICNSLFNRFSRARETANEETIKVFKSTVQIAQKKSSSISSSMDDDSSNSVNEFGSHFLTESTSTISSLPDPDPFIMWIENKDRHKYRIVKVFLKYRTGFLTPCHVHLVKLARNVVYIGVEENLENYGIVSTLDKTIRLIRSIMLDNDRRKDVSAILKLRVSPAVEKLTNLKVIHWHQLSQTLKLCLSKEGTNPDVLERFLKELLRLLESVYCQYYLSFPIKVVDKLCKSFLRCFMSVKREMHDYLAILSVKALRNLPPTSFYPLYPGLIHFVFTTRKLDPLLISPVIDHEVISERTVAKLHFLVDLCRYISGQFDVSVLCRQIEVSDYEIRCTYHRKRYRVSEERFHEFELALFHFSSVSAALARKQLYMLLHQFLADSNNSDHELLNLTS